MGSRKRLKSGDYWRVLYRQGGRDRCRWTAVLRHFRDQKEYMPTCRELKKQGYKVVLMRDKHLQSIGPPVGWEPEDADAGHIDEHGWWVRDKEAEVVEV